MMDDRGPSVKMLYLVKFLKALKTAIKLKKVGILSIARSETNKAKSFVLG